MYTVRRRSSVDRNVRLWMLMFKKSYRLCLLTIIPILINVLSDGREI